ncbi:MAG: cupin domain-containing protein [Pseudomonadota bacterium]
MDLVKQGDALFYRLKNYRGKETTMISVKDAKGVQYEAAKHSEVYGLQKITEAQSKRTTVCYSYFQPNGGAELSSSPKERIYYVVKGSITVSGGGEKHVLDVGDLVYIAPGEERDVVVNGGKPAEVLVFIVTP